MNCPKCATPLAPVDVRGTQVDECSGCRGIWFDEKELEAILAVKPRELRALRGRENDAYNRIPGKCPRDGHALIRVCSTLNLEVVVDVCPECRGIWLDGGELQKLLP